MKTIKQFLFLITGICLLAACTQTDPIFEDDAVTTTLKKDKDKTVLVSVPFKADLSVWNHTDPSDRSCGEIPIVKATMIGDGNITHLGKISTTMTFCNNFVTGEYWDTDIVFVAANGDELYASIPVGQIYPNTEYDVDYYTMTFNDKMYFTGGTGRFKDASGEAMTNAYVHLPTDEYRHKGDELWRTDFFSEGTLILKKGKR